MERHREAMATQADDDGHVCKISRIRRQQTRGYRVRLCSVSFPSALTAVLYSPIDGRVPALDVRPTKDSAGPRLLFSSCKSSQ
jgi:hypothetical protein